MLTGQPCRLLVIGAGVLAIPRTTAGKFDGTPVNSEDGKAAAGLVLHLGTPAAMRTVVECRAWERPLRGVEIDRVIGVQLYVFRALTAGLLFRATEAEGRLCSERFACAFHQQPLSTDELGRNTALHTWHCSRAARARASSAGHVRENLG
jgi:hypothetical protein